MRRFLITSPHYSGQAEIVYNTDGTLCRIDLTETDMQPSVVKGFKNRVPAIVEELAEAFTGTQVKIIEADIEVSFDMFWKKYNKKINKARCIILFTKMDKGMQLLAYMGIPAYDKYLKKESWRNKADAETYLRNRYWENEYK